MKRMFGLLLVSFLFVSCNKSATDDCTPDIEAQDSGNSTSECIIKPEEIDHGHDHAPGDETELPDENDETNNPDEAEPTLPTGAYTFGTNIHFVNTNIEQQRKFDKAVEMIKEVVATEEFKKRVLNHKYNGKKTYVDNGGYSNQRIYEMILEAAEKLQPAKNNKIDMEVELYRASTNTIGYTYANSKRIWVNLKYFESNSVSAVASNLFHEWLHKLGFGHDAKYSTSRDYSVPYAIGRMVGSIGKEL